MQFITSLFGGSGNTALTAVLALAVVLVLIVLVAWLLKFISKTSGNAVRGKNRRLTVIDTLNVDQKRQLLIVRRDNVEHLILIGGPQDVVVETGIAVTEQPAVAPARRGFSPIAPRRPTPAAAPATQEVTPEDPVVTAAPGTVLEQLQRAGHPADKKGHVSLRHTGLLRPVRERDAARDDHKTENSDEIGADSDKQSSDTDLSGNTTLENDTKTDAKRS